MTGDEMQQEQTRVRLIADAPLATTPGQQKLVRAKAEAVKRLSHPAIVSIRELGFDDNGAPYVVTECIDEPTLADVLQAGQLDEATVLDYSIQICEAVSAAHIGGVAHGNLTAENIYVCDVDGLGNQILVANFGIPGTSNGKASFQNDVEALGRLMSRALQGRRPRTEFENVILFCLEDNEEERYRDCREVLHNLLLVRQGKLPEPPMHRPGQKFVTPKVVALLVLVAVVLTFFGLRAALQSSLDNSRPIHVQGGDPASLKYLNPYPGTVPTTAAPATTAPATTVPAKTVPATTVPAKTVPATTVPATTVPATTVPPAASPAPALTPEQARAKYGLNELDQRAKTIDTKAKLKRAADKAVEYKDKAKGLWRKFRE